VSRSSLPLPQMIQSGSTPRISQPGGETRWPGDRDTWRACGPRPWRRPPGRRRAMADRDSRLVFELDPLAPLRLLAGYVAGKRGDIGTNRHAAGIGWSHTLELTSRRRPPSPRGLQPSQPAETACQRAHPGSGLPTPHRRTFASAVLASARSMTTSLRHPWLRLSSTPAHGAWAAPKPGWASWPARSEITRGLQRCGGGR